MLYVSIGPLYLSVEQWDTDNTALYKYLKNGGGGGNTMFNNLE